MASTTINGEMGIVNSNGDVTIIYPKTKASNVILNSGTDLESYLSNLDTSSDVTLPINPSASYKAVAGNMWLEV